MYTKILAILFLRSFVNLVTFQTLEARQGSLWRSVFISESRLTTGARQSGSQVYSTVLASKLAIKLACSASCHELDWCNLWCHSPLKASCLLYYMHVVAEYNESNMADALLCYTNSTKDYATGATITGVADYLPRVKEHLVDGIYSFGNTVECSATNHFYDDWYLIDIGGMKPIWEITLVMENYYTAVDLVDYEFRVGDQPVSGGDFTSYKEFAFFHGPSGPNAVIVLARDTPIIGRYVSIKRWSDRTVCNPAGGTSDAKCHLNICHLEIH